MRQRRNFHRHVRGVRMTQVMQPRSRHDPRRPRRLAEQNVPRSRLCIRDNQDQ